MYLYDICKNIERAPYKKARQFLNVDINHQLK